MPADEETIIAALLLDEELSFPIMGEGEEDHED